VLLREEKFPTGKTEVQTVDTLKCLRLASMTQCFAFATLRQKSNGYR